MIKFTMPMRLENLANKREHYQAAGRRAKSQRASTFVYCNSNRVPEEMPRSVTITRIGKKIMDDDGLKISGKHVRDGISDWCGFDDGDPRVEWKYAQRIGKEYAVEIEIE